MSISSTWVRPYRVYIIFSSSSDIIAECTVILIHRLTSSCNGTGLGSMLLPEKNRFDDSVSNIHIDYTLQVIVS